MCNICNKNGYLNMPYTPFRARINNNSLCFDSYDGYMEVWHKEEDMSIEIKYCPICGNKLI